jgi:hypothetical protein
MNYQNNIANFGSYGHIINEYMHAIAPILQPDVTKGKRKLKSQKPLSVSKPRAQYKPMINTLKAAGITSLAAPIKEIMQPVYIDQLVEANEFIGSELQYGGVAPAHNIIVYQKSTNTKVQVSDLATALNSMVAGQEGSYVEQIPLSVIENVLSTYTDANMAAFRTQLRSASGIKSSSSPLIEDKTEIAKYAIRQAYNELKTETGIDLYALITNFNAKSGAATNIKQALGTYKELSNALVAFHKKINTKSNGYLYLDKSTERLQNLNQRLLKDAFSPIEVKAFQGIELFQDTLDGITPTTPLGSVLHKVNNTAGSQFAGGPDGLIEIYKPHKEAYLGLLGALAVTAGYSLWKKLGKTTEAASAVNEARNGNVAPGINLIKEVATNTSNASATVSSANQPNLNMDDIANLYAATQNADSTLKAAKATKFDWQIFGGKPKPINIK